MNPLRHISRRDDALLERRRSHEADAPVAELFAALRQPPLPQETASQLLVLDLIHANREAPIASQPEVKPLVKRKTRLATIALATAATMAVTGGLAYAGDLPGAAQSTASDALARVGVTVPGPNQHAGTHPDTRGSSAQTHAAHTGTSQHATPNNAHGKAVSTLAHTTTATGRDKGKAISTLASGGKSNNGKATGRPTTKPGNPNPGKPASPGKSSASGGGVTTGSAASSGANATGASTSTAASGGHSAAGSQNAGTHPNS